MIILINFCNRLFFFLFKIILRADACQKHKMSQKLEESECLHLSVDLVAKSIAAKFLWLNSARLKVQKMLPGSLSQGALALQNNLQGRSGVTSSEAWCSLSL